MSLIAAGLAYFGANGIALLFPDSGRVLVAIWPAGGIGLAVLLLCPRRRWRSLLGVMFVAGNAANLIAHRPLLASVGFMGVNLLESYLCAALILRWCGPGVRFHRMRDISALMTAALAVNAVTALPGAAIASALSGEPFAISYRTWWIADGLGIFVIAPLIVTWLRPDPAAEARGKWWLAELAIVVAGTLAFAVVYFGPLRFTFPLVVHSYMLVVPLAWAAIRLGLRGVTTVAVCLHVAILAPAVHGYGAHPLGGESPTEHTLWVQLFIGISAGIAYLLAASNAEHDEKERILADAEARLRAIGDNLPLGAVYQVEQQADGTMRFNHLSAGVRRLLGIDPERVLADPAVFYERMAEPDRRRLGAARSASLEGGVFDETLTMTRPDGTTRRIRFASASRILPDGRPLWDGILTDITEQEAAGKALRESEARYRHLVEYAPLGLTLLDRETVVYANPEAARIVGAPRVEEMIGRSVWDFVPPEYHDLLRLRQREMEATGRPVAAIEVPLRRLDGSAVEVETRGVPVPQDGRTIIQNMLVDISDRKQADQELRRNASQLRALSSRLQSLREEERTRLAREIHDHLGQLLTALGLDLRLIEKRLTGMTDAELRMALQAKVISARALADETVSAVQKLASELRPAVLDRLGLEAAIESESRVFGERSGIQLTLSLPQEAMETPPEIATALFRILQEVLTNVARHARAGRVDLSLRRTDRHLELTICDDGVGIREGDIDNPSSLGLLGMRERAQILHGRITFARGPDRGTIVIVNLPLNGAGTQTS